MQRLLLCLVLASCGLIKIQHQGEAVQGAEGRHILLADGKNYRVGPYWGPECERLELPKHAVYANEEPEPTSGKQPNLGHELADQILRLECVETIISATTEPERNTYVVQHFRFDELFFDHATAAMMLVECLKAESCLHEGAPPHRNFQPKRDDGEAYQVGMMRWYAERVDATQVAAAIAAYPGLPAAAQTAFLTDLAKAKARVIAVSDQFVPEAKRLFLELPETIYAEHAAARAKSASFIASLNQLTAAVKFERVHGTVSDAAIGKLRDLRIAYHASCRAAACAHDAIFGGITKQLFWAYVANGDALAARAESRVIDALAPTAADDIAKRQTEQIETALNNGSRIDAARQQGLDPATARSTGTSSTLDLRDVHPYRPTSETRIVYAQLVPEERGIDEVKGKVASLEKRPEGFLVKFQDEVTTISESTGCHETNRVERIDRDGHLNYRTVCSGTESHASHHKVPPITLPATEVGQLRSGDELTGLARAGTDPRMARVLSVWRGGKMVRLREVPI